MKKELTPEEREHIREIGRRHYWKHRKEILAKSQAKRDSIKEQKRKEELAKNPPKPKRVRKPRLTPNPYPTDKAVVKAVRERFFLDFSECHCAWLRELVAKYKEYGVFPVYPTQIADYYTDKEDMIIALLSAFLMKWENGNEIEQIASMRKILGDHPYEWFKNREFIVLSVGREQNKKIEGYNHAIYWKIAKLYDVLYDTCQVISDNMKPSEALKGKNLRIFLDTVEKRCELSDTRFKREVIELVLKTSDGLGRGLLRSSPQKVKSPYTTKMRRYIGAWFPNYLSGLWTFDEAVRLFRLENDYDFFYAYLAHTELMRLNPVGCRKYLTRYQSRWELGRTFPPSGWKLKPEIKFTTY